MSAACIGTVVGGDTEIDISNYRVDVICQLYDDKRFSTSLPIRRMEICKLASQYMNLDIKTVNGLLNGDIIIPGISRELTGDKCIVIKKGVSHQDGDRICKKFMDLGIWSTVVFVPIEEVRDEKLNILIGK